MYYSLISSSFLSSYSVALRTFASLRFRRMITSHSDRTAAVSTESPILINSLTDIIDQYDYLIIDQWGVLHNGKAPYTTVLRCLENLWKRKKEMILLSNSSRRKDNAIKGMKKVGIDYDKYFEDVITSGEVGWQLLKDRQLSFLLPEQRQVHLPLKAVIIGNGEDDEEYATSAGVIPSDPASANFVLVRGTFTVLTADASETQTTRFPSAQELMENIEAVLTECIRNQLPMLVTNPDVFRPDASLSPMPGQIGVLYEKLSNAQLPIEYIGKPYPTVYRLCKDHFSRHCEENPEGRYLCIGDSLEHDIQGANKNGMDSLWIMNGVHTVEMNRLIDEKILVATKVLEGSDEAASSEVVESFLQLPKYQRYHPTYIIPCFK